MLDRFSLLCFLSVLALSPSARADLKITAESLREYQLPGSFNIAEAAVLVGANNVTHIVSTVRASPESSACGVVNATAEGATIFEYRFDDQPTRCLGVVSHPKGGVFLRGDNPLAAAGTVSGFTTFLDAEGKEVWVIPDQRLVDAQAKPAGTGHFLGTYDRPLPVMAYSEKLDKLIAFTVGRLDLGLDQKFISQAHVINVDSGQFRVSGQTFGQSGVGITGGVSVRDSDGHFVVFYHNSDNRGAFFYTYDGRQDIEFFKPRGEDWDDRYLVDMTYQNDLLNLLWTSDQEEDSETRLTVTNDQSSELWTALFDSQYKFVTGIDVNLGLPRTMWIGKNEYIILHQVDGFFFLRHIDLNGASFGIGRLDNVIPVPPIAVVVTNDGDFKLLGYDDTTRYISEFDLSFDDLPDYDPEVGPQLPGDVGIPADIGISDVLEAAGCCATISNRRSPAPLLFLILGLILTIQVRRHRD